jgi:hypothetical protein
MEEGVAMKPWVKLYTEINRDADMGMLTWAQRGIWSALLALAGDIDARDAEEHETGQLDTEARVAWMIRCEASELRAALAEFARLGMVEDRDGILYLPNYGKRQAKPPSQERPAARDRQRKHRERVRDEGTCSDGVTTLSQGDRDDVTTQNRLDKIRLDQTESQRREDRDEMRTAGAVPDSVSIPLSDSVSASEDAPEPDERESPELEEAIRRWSGALRDSGAVESNLTQAFAIWGGYPQIRAPDMVRLVNDTGRMVQGMRNVQRPMAYFFRSIRGHLERKLGPPRDVGAVGRIAEPERVRIPGVRAIAEVVASG